MRNSAKRFLCGALALIGASGCASTVGNLADLDEVSFTVNQTRKIDVSNTLGFPASRAVVDDVEYWGYPKRAELVGLYYAVPTSSTTVTAYTITKIPDGPPGMDEADVIYAFNEDGVLTAIHEVDKK